MNRKQIKQFYESTGISVEIVKQFANDYFTLYRVEATKQVNGGTKIKAKGSCIVRRGTDDLIRPYSDAIAEGVAQVRAERGTYKVLHGKTVHHPLYQGEKI